MKNNRLEQFLLLIILGSLWGFFEMLALPIFALCTIGIFFLVIARRIVDIPGTSILIGLIVCFYKTYSAHFFICQWAGVMALAVSFDFFTSVVFKRNWYKKYNPVLIGILANISALIVFVAAVTYIVAEPYWVEGGLERALSYALGSSLPAALLSGFISAPIALLSVKMLSQLNFTLNRKLVPGIYLLATLCLWIAASLR